MSLESLPGDSAAAPAVTPPGSGSGSRTITRTSCSTVDKMIGRVIGKARILKRLGRGGMGDVYLATHPDYPKSVAVKILPPDMTRNDELLARFRREAESAARLEHPNLVEIYDIGVDQGFHFIVMACVDGMNLQELLEEKKLLPPQEAARIALDVARGLKAVHEEGIIHRDIKPPNILLSQKGEVKIVDFGLALDAEDKSSLTVPGAIMGTPWYLAPEQAEGKSADHRSDLYSLGVCLYLMASGERPFVGESHMSVLYKQINEKPKDPRHHNPDIPPELVEIILKLLEKKPDRRYPTAGELALDLDRFLKGTYIRKTVLVAPKREKPEAEETPRPRRRRVLTAVLATWILAVLAVLGGAFLSGKKTLPPLEDPRHPELVKQAAIAEAKGEAGHALRLYQEAARLRETTEVKEGLERVQAKTPPVVADPAGLRPWLADPDLKQIAERDYAPVLQRLLDRHAGASATDKAALSKIGFRLSSAYKVVTQFRAIIATERQPALKLRDGRTTPYPFTPVPSIAAESVVEYARKSRDLSEIDVACFYLVEGEGLKALDSVLRPECKPHLEDLVDALLSQAKDVREIALRLSAAKDLPSGACTKVDLALKR
jgi:tRNA A-37 threonylcarbamoyl transferase component Bud32